MIFTVYYLICAEQADEMTKRVRGALTLQHMRVSWEKPNTPYIQFLSRLSRPKTRHCQPRKIRLPRPEFSDEQEPIDAWLYFTGTKEELRRAERVVMDIPGGGFVAMDPRCHDDKLMAWACKLRCPVLALDYKKAPEHPFPYALNECHDAYFTLMSTQGRSIGLSGERMPKVILSGDSAGGNLATGLMCLLIDEMLDSGMFKGLNAATLPLPEALVLVYPALDMNIRSWLSDEQMSLIKKAEVRARNRGVLERKISDYSRLTPKKPHGSFDENVDSPMLKPLGGSPRKLSRTGMRLLDDEPLAQSPIATAPEKRVTFNANGRGKESEGQGSATSLLRPPKPQGTRLALSSILSYFNDRILTPEMMRAMIFLYIGPNHKPDFATDWKLSPILAPDNILAMFPKTYLLTGERDPLVDDTCVFEGRLREAHRQRFKERQELGLEPSNKSFDGKSVVETHLIPGISHGFLQFVSVYPAGRTFIDQCSSWMRRAFAYAEQVEAETPRLERKGNTYFRHHSRRNTGDDVEGGEGEVSASSTDNDELPLEFGKLAMTPIAGAPRRSKKKFRGSGRGRRKGSKSPPEEGRWTTRNGTTSPSEFRHGQPVRLPSSADLMGRRMLGLTGGLMGEGGAGENAKTP